MINIIKETISDIPILHVIKEEFHDKSLPTVVYYHGFNGDKSSSLTLAYQIAEKGYRVILPDCVHHGDRKMEISETELQLAFWDVVLKNVEEFKEITAYLIQNGYSEKDRIGVGGTSMGGISTYALLMTYDWIKSAAVLMGTPYISTYAKDLIRVFNSENEMQITQEEVNEVIEQLAPYDPTLQLDKIIDRPLFIWHGMDDNIVPYDYSPAFYQLAQKQYTNPNLIRFVNEKGKAHHISRLSMDEASKWFERFL